MESQVSKESKEKWILWVKVLLSKDHYCYKIHILLMKYSAYFPCIDKSLYGPPIFKRKFWSLRWFFKNLNRSINKEWEGGSYFIIEVWSHPWKHQIYPEILSGCGQACLGMLKVMEMLSQLCLNNESNYKVGFLLVVRDS